MDLSAVSTVGLGCNNFGKTMETAQAVAVVHAAIDAGVTLLDTADVYGDGNGASEEALGAALQGRRDEVILATKFGMTMGGDPQRRGASPRWIRQALEDSLRRLRTDHIDLYQLHEPDPDTPIAETLGTLGELIEAGTVGAIGCSKLAGWQLADADWTARTQDLPRFVSTQAEWSLLERGAEREVVPACARFGIGMLPFFPLHAGLLTGKYRRGEPPPPGSRVFTWGARFADLASDANLDRVEALEGWARQRGHSLLELAIGWLASQPVVLSVIAGATSPEQVKANVAAGGWRLTAEELAEVDALAA